MLCNYASTFKFHNPKKFFSRFEKLKLKLLFMELSTVTLTLKLKL